MLDVIERFKQCVETFHVLSYEQEGNSLRIKVLLTFTDRSSLSVKEYLFADGQRKYAYHWMNAQGDLICRWDNARHYPQISTFPSHKHLGDKIVESVETAVEDVLSVIYDKIVNK